MSSFDILVKNRFMAESALVTGEVQYIENNENWMDKLLSLVEENHRVFMIEGYGLIILADTGLQVCFEKWLLCVGNRSIGSD